MSRHQRSFQRSSNQPAELLAGVVVEHIDVQLALLGQAGEGQVAAAQIADDRVDRDRGGRADRAWRAGVPQEQLDDQLPGPDLGASRRSAASSSLVGAPMTNCWRNSSASFFLRRRAVWLSIASASSVRLSAVRSSSSGSRCMPTSRRQLAVAARPRLDQGRQLAPAAQVEVADAEIGAMWQAGSSREAPGGAAVRCCRRCAALSIS